MHKITYGPHIVRKTTPPISGKPGQSMVPHLSKCVYVAPELRARAAEEIEGKKGRFPPILGRSASMPLPITTGSDYPTTSGWTRATSAMPSPVPSPLLLSAPLLNFERPPTRKRPRTSSFASTDESSTASPVAKPWSPSLQREFGEDFCKLLIATRSAWNTANNPQVCLFFEEWIPGAIVPDRRTLSGPILDREAGKVLYLTEKQERSKRSLSLS